MKTFISNASGNRDLADNLCRRLRERGIETATDSEIATGSQWIVQLREALRKADAIILLLAPAQSVSSLERREWSKVLEAVLEDPGKKLIPVLIGGGEAPAFLRRLDALRIGGPDEWEPLAGQLADWVYRQKSASEQFERVSSGERDRWQDRVSELVLWTNTLRSD